MANTDERPYPRREVNEGEVSSTSNEHYSTRNDSYPDGMTRRENPISSNVAYRDGYLKGRVSEQRVTEANLATRDSNNASRGVLIGIIFTALAGLVIAAIFMLNERNRTPVIVPNVTAPSASPSPTPSQSPQVRERIIERDRVVPVPQSEAPPPNINITVPNTEQQTPTTQTAPNAPTTPSSSQAPATSPEQASPSTNQ